MSSGVPQGSVLGLASFTFFMNIITTCINHCAIRLFANDTLLYTMGHSDTDVTNMQCDLDKLQEWSTANEMKFNALKCNLIVFGGKPDESAPKYYLNGKLLTSMQSVKYLGVYLSHDMKLCCHIDYIANKALKVLGLIKHLLYDSPKMKTNHDFNTRHSNTFTSIVCNTNKFLHSF